LKEGERKRRVVWISFHLDHDPLSLSEDLDSVIHLLSDDDSVEMIEGDSLWTIELTLFLSSRSKRRDGLSLRIKNLNPVVSPLSDDDVVVMIDGYSRGIATLTVS